MKFLLLNFLLASSAIIYNGFAFILVDDELGFIGSDNENTSLSSNNTNKTLSYEEINWTAAIQNDDIQELFDLYDRVFNETSIPNILNITNNTTDMSMNNLTDEFSNFTNIFLMNETDARESFNESFMKSFENMEDMEVIEEFTKELNGDENITNVFAGQHSDEVEPSFQYSPNYDDKIKTVTASYLDEFEFVTNSSDTFNSTEFEYEEPTSPNSLAVNDLSAFALRKFEQFLESKISSIVFNEEYSSNESTYPMDNNSSIQVENATDHDNLEMQENDTNSDINVTLQPIKNTTDDILFELALNDTTTYPYPYELETTEEEFTVRNNEYIAASEISINLQTIQDTYSTATDIEQNTLFKENISPTTEMITTTPTAATAMSSYESSSNSNDETIMQSAVISSKITRDIDNIGIKDALSQEKLKFPEKIFAYPFVLVALVAFLCIGIGIFISVCSIFTIQKLKILRFNDTVAPA